MRLCIYGKLEKTKWMCYVARGSRGSSTRLVAVEDMHFDAWRFTKS